MRKPLSAVLASLITLCAIAMLPVSGYAQAQLGPDASSYMRSGEVIVGFPAGTSDDKVREIAAGLNCDVIEPIAYTPGVYLFGAKDRTPGKVEKPSQSIGDLVVALKNIPGVTASPNLYKQMRGYRGDGKTRGSEPTGTKFTPDDPLYGTNQLWHYDMVRMSEAWAFQFGDGTPTRVAVIDSGVEASHPDFINADGTNMIVDSKAFVTGTTVGDDPVGHGTHVAGTVAASTNNKTGVSGIAGYRKNGVNVQLMGLRISDATGGLSTAASIAALNYCLQTARTGTGPRVINMSYGGPLGSSGLSDPEPKAVLDCIAEGIVVVGASGNDGRDLAGSPDFPTDLPGVIKVNAIAPSGKLASYSNYGGTNKKIIAAPGGAGQGDTPALPVWSTYRLGVYTGLQGTSMASPHVAGAATLLAAAGVPASEIYGVLAATATAPNDTPNPDKYGPGIIDVYSALVSVSDPTPRIIITGLEDRGTNFLNFVPIKAQLSGTINMVANNATTVNKQVRKSDVTVSVYRLGDTAPIRTFVGGTDFLIPSVNAAQRRQSFTVDIPSVAADSSARPTDSGIKLPDTQLPLGSQYKIITAIKGVTQSTQFITLAPKQLPAGRSMVALPFRASMATGTGNVENLLLGTAATFSLTRYNPLRLPSEDDYARYRSNGSATDSAARFLLPTTSGSPVAYEVSDPNTSISPIGSAYWLDLASTTSIDITRLTQGRASDAGIQATNAVGIRVSGSGGGWNMIGAPFTYPVEWSAVSVQSGGVNYSIADAVANGIVSPVLVGYDAERRDYAYSILPGGTLQPFQGYWMRAYRDAVLIIPPRDASTSRSVVNSKPRVDGWTARLVASVAGDQDGQNYFGQAQGAADGADRLDILKPPAGAGHAYVRFESHDAASTRALAYDLRNSRTAQRQDWVAAVTSDRANADVTLSWEGMRNVPKRYKLSITDQATGQTVSMQGRSSYTYRATDAGATRRFTIALEPQASAGGLLLTNVRTAGSTRAESGMTVRFQVNQDADVNGVIRTMSGRTIANLTGATRAQAGGDAALRWNGKGQDGAAIPAGPYVLEVVARASDGTTTRIARTIQHLR